MPAPDAEHVPLHPDDLFQNPSPDDPSLAASLQHVLESATGPQHWFTAPDAAQIRADAESRFADWFRKNYPGPDTIIHKPDWHAPKIFRAALAAMKGGDA
jgi:hypothetical protein